MRVREGPPLISCQTDLLALRTEFRSLERDLRLHKGDRCCHVIQARSRGAHGTHGKHGAHGTTEVLALLIDYVRCNRRCVTAMTSA